MNKRLKRDYERYLNIIYKCGGAVRMNSLPFLLNKEYQELIDKEELKEYNYDKVAADIRAIEKLIDECKVNEVTTYISNVKNQHGKPNNYKYIVLTHNGWYKFEKKSRSEIAIGSSTQARLKLNAFKNIINKKVVEKHEHYVQEILKDYKYIEQVYTNENNGSHMLGKVEVDKFLDTDSVLIEDIRSIEEEKIYYIKVMYLRTNYTNLHFCKTVDKLLGVFEREKSLDKIGKDFKIQIEIDILTSLPLIPKKMIKFFNKYKREYAYYSAYHIKDAGRDFDDKKLSSYKSHKIIKRFNFIKIEDDYSLTSY